MWTLTVFCFSLSESDGVDIRLDSNLKYVRGTNINVPVLKMFIPPCLPRVFLENSNIRHSNHSGPEPVYFIQARSMEFTACKFIQGAVIEHHHPVETLPPSVCFLG